MVDLDPFRMRPSSMYPIVDRELLITRPFSMYPTVERELLIKRCACTLCIIKIEKINKRYFMGGYLFR
jgi:hypothetical protein